MAVGRVASGSMAAAWAALAEPGSPGMEYHVLHLGQQTHLAIIANKVREERRKKDKLQERRIKILEHITAK